MGPATLALIVPIIALLIPIVAILVKHQKDMAMMYHQTGQLVASTEVEDLRKQVEDLRQLLTNQTLVLDDIRQTQKQLAAHAEPVKQRLQGQ
jgi:hypothetical protein